MLVCYEPILTGESSAVYSETIYAKSSNRLAETYLPRRSLASAAKRCDEKSQGSDCGREEARENRFWNNVREDYFNERDRYTRLGDIRGGTEELA